MKISINHLTILQPCHAAYLKASGLSEKAAFS